VTKKDVLPPLPRKRTIVAPALEALVRTPAPGDLVDVTITFEDSVQIPYFPKLDARHPKDHPENVRLQTERDALVAQLTTARAPRYAQRAADFQKLGVRSPRRFGS